MRFTLNFDFFSHRRLPIILQTEAAECGLVCVGMIANYWGHRIDLGHLRKRFSVSIKGVNFKNLISMANGLDLLARPLKLDMELLQSLKLPAILHWNMNHFVVLKKVTSKYAVIHDPALGVRKLSLEEVSTHFTGAALELTPSNKFEKKVEVQEIRLSSLFGTIVGLKSNFFWLFLLGLALQLCLLAAPFYMQWVADEALVTADKDLIIVLGLGFTILVFLQLFMSALRSWMTAILSTNLNFQWMGNAFSHLLKLPLPYFEKRHTGDIVSRFQSLDILQRSITSQFVEVVLDGILALMTLVLMFIYSVKLGFIALITLTIYVLLRISLFNSWHEANSEQIVHSAKQQSHFLESVRGMQSLRLFNRGPQRHSIWLNYLTNQFNAQLRITKLTISFQGMNNFIFNIERILIISVAAFSILNAEFSIGMMFAFLSYKEQFSQRTSSLIDKIFEFRMLRIHGERIADVLLSDVEDNKLEFERDIASIESSIELRNVTFRYSDNEPYIVKNLNLFIPSGRCVAITGLSGSGKTTLIKLILGLLEPNSGEILVGGENIYSIGLNNYREMLSTVMQDDQLFAGTIAENISFFDSEPSQSHIESVAKLAAIDHDISRMPMRYQTSIGDIGTGLSGGQKQRILLARALYKNPRILILDEATSHLDVTNEALVNDAIEKISMTRILVAHRPQTISMAQQVIKIQDGEIVQNLEQVKELNRSIHTFS